jgi:hypothetical protein
MNRWRFFLLTAGVLALVPWTRASLPAQTIGEKLHITALAVNMSNIGTGATNTVLIDINRWTPEAERQKLMDTFRQNGPDALLTALQKQPEVGFIRLPTTVGYQLRYAHEMPQPDGGRRIVIATDRPIGVWEAREQPRSINYPFTLIEIRTDKNGKGEGKLSVATKIMYEKDTNTIVLENYASEPVRLQNVEVTVKK